MSLFIGCGKPATIPVAQQKRVAKNSLFFDKISKASWMTIKSYSNPDQYCDVPKEKWESLAKAFEGSYLGSKTDEWPVKGYLECQVEGRTNLVLLSDVGQVLLNDEYWHGVDTDVLMAMLKDCQPKPA